MLEALVEEDMNSKLAIQTLPCQDLDYIIDKEENMSKHRKHLYSVHYNTSPKDNVYSETNSAISSVCDTSTGNISNRTISLSIKRRPSDNIFSNFVDETQTSNELSQPPKHFITKVERPISNNSIVTQTSEVFSSIQNLTPYSHVNSSSNSSIVEGNDNQSICTHNDESKTITPKKSASEHIHQNNRAKYSFTNCLSKSQLFTSPTTTSSLKSNPGISSRSAYSTDPSTLPSKEILFASSQRYKLRREQNKNALQNLIKQKEKFYDEQESQIACGDNQSMIDDVDNCIIWNVPVVSSISNAFLSTMTAKKHKMKMPQSKSHVSLSSNHLENGLFLNSNDVPPLPIPGLQNTTDFQFIQQTSKNLSSIYQHSSMAYSKNKLMERTESADYLSLGFKIASDQGIEDLKLVSDDKIRLLSSSRPSWLPPKDSSEKKLHERQIMKAVSVASLEQLDKNREYEQRMRKNELNRSKIITLFSRGLIRASSLKDLRKIVWETPIPDDQRYNFYSTILQGDKFISEKFIDPISSLEKTLSGMNFPLEKLNEIESMIGRIPSMEIHIQEKLRHFLKLKSISTQGLVVGDEYLFYHLLQNKALDIYQIWELVNMLQMTCFNEITKDKYDFHVLNPKGVIASYVKKDKSYRGEFNSKCLNIVTWWNIMIRLEHSLFIWIMDIIVVENSQSFKNFNSEIFKEKDWEYYRDRRVVINYKILSSLSLTVLLKYHFGFDNLHALAMEDKNFYIIGNSDDPIDQGKINITFIKKWQYYYKKF